MSWSMATALARPCLPARPSGSPASQPADQPAAPGSGPAATRPVPASKSPGRPPNQRRRPATAVPARAATNSTDLTTQPLTKAAHHATQPGRAQRRVLHPLEVPGQAAVRHPHSLHHRYLHPPSIARPPHRKAPRRPRPLHAGASRRVRTPRTDDRQEATAATGAAAGHADSADAGPASRVARRPPHSVTAYPPLDAP